MKCITLKPLLLISIFFIASHSYATTFKVASLSPDGSQWMKTMKQAAEEVKTATQGRVAFRFYPGGVMGNDDAVLRKMRLGQLHGAVIPGGALARFAPDTQIYNLPLLFKSYEEVDYVRAQLDKKIEQDFEDAGYVNFGLAEGGFAYLMAKGAVIRSPNDLKKRKVWVPANDAASQSAAKTFEISPVPLSLGDVLAGLQTGMVDTVTSSPIATIALQWHTQVNSITNLPLVYFYGVLAISKKSFNKISDEDQTTVRTIMTAAFKTINSQNRTDNESAYKALAAQGITTITPTAQQVSDWEAKATASIENYLKKGGINHKTYDEVSRLLTTFRDSQK
ncbi:MAG: TRAP transporter substrate-binding protein DctP [Sinobacterium sp.]|nr:TRAP transporter substrate-binding protein DctP [Sinobacterium sp.]